MKTKTDLIKEVGILEQKLEDAKKVDSVVRKVFAKILDRKISIDSWSHKQEYEDLSWGVIFFEVGKLSQIKEQSDLREAFEETKKTLTQNLEIIYGKIDGDKHDR